MKTIFIVVAENMSGDLFYTYFSQLKDAQSRYRESKLDPFNRFKYLLQSEEGKKVWKSYIDRKPEPFEGATCLAQDRFQPTKVKP